MKNKGDVINLKWEIVEPLGGNSGQGNAYKVINSEKAGDNTKYVIKLLKKINDKTRDRFKKEIIASVELKHPNIVKVVEYRGVNSRTDEPYLVTELCSGGELNKSKIEKLSLLEKLKIFESICDAIAFAHEKEVIHRDIKPSNIFLDNQKDKNPIIGDFGLCFFNTDETDERLTETLEQVGAKNFRPPEAEYGIIHEMEPSFDVYSLGKLLYWLLSNGGYVVRENITHPNYDLRKNNEKQAIHFAYEIFGKSILENPDDRYSNATEMLKDVKNMVDFVENDARYLDCNITQKCIFCRIGEYEFITSPDTSEGKFNYNKSRAFGFNIFDAGGYSPHEQPTNVSWYAGFLIGCCNNCGNVQHFRIEHSMNDDRTYSTNTNWRNYPKPSKY